jgi:hypothetical protein
MATFHIVEARTISSNTAAHGHGKFPDRIDYVTLTVEADTVRKAQHAAKRRDPTLRFSGDPSTRVVTEAELADRTWIERPPGGTGIGLSQWRPVYTVKPLRHRKASTFAPARTRPCQNGPVTPHTHTAPPHTEEVHPLDRITKRDLERRLDLLNHYIGKEAYDLSWATSTRTTSGGVRIYEADEGEDMGRRGTKLDIYEVLGGMCHVAWTYVTRIETP